MLQKEDKVCSKCQLQKPQSRFHKNSKSRDGLHCYCKECRAKIQKEYRQENKEKITAYNKQYYKDNIERINHHHKEWSRRNRDKMDKFTKEYYQRNPERMIVHNQLNWAVKSGKIIRPSICSGCGGESNSIEGHHDDYSKPLEVVWLCRECHIKFHKKAMAQIEA